MHYTVKHHIPSSYLHYTDSFATVQFSLDTIKQHEIDKITTWIHLVNTHEDEHSTHQINIDGSHPHIHTILQHITVAVPTYTKLTYIHIHHAENSQIDSTIHKLIQAVRQHPNGHNITVHTDSSRGQLYL
jgi:hypothetical protein